MSRISTETLTFGILALLFGLGGAYLARLYLQPDEVEEAPAPPMRREVPIASIDLQPGKRLTMGDIAIRGMTAAEMADMNIDPERTMTNAQQIIGRILKEPVRRGQPFATDALYPQGMRPSLSEKLRPGFRAYTIEIEPNAAVNGFAGPGTIVDVLFRTSSSFDRQGLDFPDLTRTLLEGVEILALGPSITPNEDVEGPIETVTLAVTPEQATRLKIVEGRGTLSLAMRDPNETGTVTGTREQAEATLADVLGIEAGPPPYWVTEIYQRNRMDRRVFPIEQVEDVEQSFDSGLPERFSAPVAPPGRSRSGPRP